MDEETYNELVDKAVEGTILFNKAEFEALDAEARLRVAETYAELAE